MAIYLGNLELATGGGATNTGLPVNSYTSFYVNTTGNPTGYNSATGLYIHPNGDQWLKTGKTIIDAAGNYPAATLGTFGYTGRQNTAATSVFSATSVDSFWNGGGGYLSVYTQYDWDGNTLNSFTWPDPGGISSISNGSSNVPVLDPVNNVIWVYYWLTYQNTNRKNFWQAYDLNTGTQVFSSITNSTGPFHNDNARGAQTIVNGNTSTPILVGRASSETGLRAYDVSDPTNPVGVTLTGSPGVGPSDRMLTSPNADCYYHSSNGSTTFTEYNINSGATGNSITYSSLIYTWNTDYTFASPTQYWTNSPANISEHASAVGDVTARTDADTGQPLYIKIK